MLVSDENVTAEKPDKMLAVICGAVAKAYTEIILRPWKPSQNINVPWKKVKFLVSKDILRAVFTIDFIYEGVRYKFTATRSAPHSFTLYLSAGFRSSSY